MRIHCDSTLKNNDVIHYKLDHFLGQKLNDVRDCPQVFKAVAESTQGLQNTCHKTLAVAAMACCSYVEWPSIG